MVAPAGEDEAVDSDDDSRAFEIPELGMLNLAVDLARLTLLMARMECPKAMRMPKTPSMGMNLAPLRKPSALSPKLRLEGIGAGGK